MRFIALALLMTLATGAAAEAPGYRPCDMHNGMKVWFVETNEFKEPVTVRAATVEMNDAAWQKKCKADLTGEKSFVPITFINRFGTRTSDTRWPFNLYRTRAEAQRNFHLRLGAHPK